MLMAESRIFRSSLKETIHMKPVTVDTDRRYRGMETIILENNCLKVVILPELGAKMLHLVHKPSDTEMLWLNPRLTPRSSLRIRL